MKVILQSLNFPTRNITVTLGRPALVPFLISIPNLRNIIFLLSWEDLQSLNLVEDASDSSMADIHLHVCNMNL